MMLVLETPDSSTSSSYDFQHLKHMSNKTLYPRPPLKCKPLSSIVTFKSRDAGSSLYTIFRNMIFAYLVD